MDRNYDKYFNNGNLPPGYEDPGEQIIPTKENFEEEPEEQEEEQ